MEYDAIVIGAGQAGPPLAERLGQAGQRVAVIERHRMGGTCVNVGCIPTKCLVGSARVAYYAREAGRFGVDLQGDVSVDMARVKARKDEIAGASEQGVTNWLDGMEGVDVIKGHARFVDPRTVAVDGTQYTAERIFLDVGARARVPDWLEAADVPYLTNSSMMEVDYVPAHLLIMGGSYIGLEFAQMYRRFGSEVTVIEMKPQVMGREDDDVAVAIREILEGEGVRFRVAAECLSVRKTQDGIAVRVSCEEAPGEEEGSDLLAAMGRVPNTDDLGLENTGIELNERGFIPVDDELRTQVDGIWALGEANGRGGFTHTTYHDFEIVAANLLDDDPRRVTDRLTCYGLFIDPPLGRIGMTEREVRATGRSALIGTRPMSRVGRAREFGDTRGFMKVLVDAETEEILGASILGMNGDEVVHELLDVMYARQPYTVISRSVAIHPTVSELIPTMLQDLRPLV
ncbi:MAG: FAD-containing oxidoreductase [Gammaproteobacteria bacterium]|nr:FAD-containing oxidoreductase [Gammaproteobacteria bacterium]